GIIHPLTLILGLVLAAACFSSFGLILSAPPSNIPSNIMMISSLVRFPLVFISGIFIPLEIMPPWGQIIALFSPLTYFTDLVRYTLQGTSYFPVLWDFIILLVFTVLFFTLAVKLHKRTMSKRI
ncbi:MAG TPA: ABC transporter permease, partial [Methanobacterium subterraneum]|nr:ABC transporter permease [Methanobacterium subterraneum]